MYTRVQNSRDSALRVCCAAARTWKPTQARVTYTLDTVARVVQRLFARLRGRRSVVQKAALPRYRRRLGGGRPCGASLHVTAACLHESDFSLLKRLPISRKSVTLVSRLYRPFASRVLAHEVHEGRGTSPLRPRRRREGGWRVYSHHRTGPVTCTICDLPIVLSGHRPRRSTGSTLGASPSRAGGAPRMSHPTNSERAFALLHERLRRILRACHSRARAALWRLSGVRQGP
jgi:hypothetical protein